MIEYIRGKEAVEAPRSAIFREFGALLPAEALRESLGKLEKLGCLEMEEEQVGLTFREYYVYL